MVRHNIFDLGILPAADLRVQPVLGGGDGGLRRSHSHCNPPGLNHSRECPSKKKAQLAPGKTPRLDIPANVDEVTETL